MEPAKDRTPSKDVAITATLDEMTPEQKLLRAIFGDVSESPRRGKRKDVVPVSVSDFEVIFHAPAWQRIGLIRDGVSARDVKELQERLGIPQGVFLDSLRMSTATLNRKVSKQENLSPEDSERVLGISKLIGQVGEMVRQSGDIKGFDAPRWLANWLQQPVPALGGAYPLDFMDTLEGQAMVSQLLARMQSGAYS
jgi:putative toxin-antitoxin system antitoxin component (TIGR02293 family)